MKAKKKIWVKILICFVTILIVIPLLSLSVFAGETKNINSNDLAIIEKIYNDNSEILNWDIKNPLSIENIKWDIVDNNYCLTEIDLSGTEIVGEIDLSDCTHLTDYSFSNTNIKSIILPMDMINIPISSFEGCSNLEYINIPVNVETIENSAFKNCTNLKTVIIYSYVDILSNAFSGCISLECVTNAYYIDSIGRNAFANCSNLVFYDEDPADSYIKNYAQSMNYGFSSNMVSNVTGYVSIMNTANEKDSHGKPYKLGSAYLYDERDVLIKKQQLDEEGKFFFDKLSIGSKYRIVLDGEFAIKRNKYFVASKTDNYISTKEKSIPLITCDFNKDDTITIVDAETLYSKMRSRDEDMELYDLDGDSGISVSDAGIIYATVGFSYDD